MHLHTQKCTDIQNNYTNEIPEIVDDADDYDLRATLSETVVAKASFSEFWSALLRFREAMQRDPEFAA